MRVFYSWQSDTPGKVGRAFVREALDAAVSDLQVDDADRPTIDQDTQGVLGSPPIAETILEKIRDAKVVVADVTLTGATPGGKRLANSNVCIELGYALGIHGDRVLLKVMNTHYGAPEELPFDLAHRRWPVRFQLAPDAPAAERRRQFDTLVATLRSILQEYIEATRPPRAGFTQTASTRNAAAYWREAAEPLVPAVPDWLTGYRDADPLIYLRIWPRDPISPLAPELINDYKRAALPPLMGRGGWSTDRNRYGTMTYVGSKETGLLATTQVLKSGEVWGVNEYLLRKRDKYPLFVPTQAYEEGLRRWLSIYLEAARTHYGYPANIAIETGLVNVDGFKLAMGENEFWGPIFDEFRIGVDVNMERPPSIDEALLVIFNALYQAAGGSRPENLYGFPSARRPD